jgi:carbon monoxide dehydrogenase subunit G
MLIESEFTFDAPREALYDGLHDPEILAGALPGTLLEMTDEDRYEGEMEVSIGPVTAARFTVVVELKDKVRPERFDMHVDGKGKAGFVKGIANIEFEELDGGTLMKYRADLQVGGRVASVGQRLLDSVGKSMSKQGLEAVSRSLNARLAPADGAAVAAPATTSHAAALPTTRRGRLGLYLVVAIIAAALLVLLL